MQLFFTRSIRLVFIVTLSSLITQRSIAQEHTFNSWLAWFNNIKFNEKWGMNHDIQFRGSSNWSNHSMLLIRPGVNYYLNERHTAALGYAVTLVTHELAADSRRLTEHRIWQQYIISGTILGVPVQHRFRLEQRFLKRPDETAFAQRARYFIRSVLPLRTHSGSPFRRGLFMSLQNELFFNFHNQKATNGKWFDQNRAYASLGFRFSEKYDFETGYLNQFLMRKSTPHSMTHTWQWAVYSKF